jgi:hypothetical protein
MASINRNNAGPRAFGKIRVRIISGRRRDPLTKNEPIYKKRWLQTVLLTALGWFFVQYVSNYSPCHSQLEASNDLVAKNLYESVQRRTRILELAEEMVELDKNYRKTYGAHMAQYESAKARISSAVDPSKSFALKEFEKVDFPELARNVDYEISKWREYGILRPDLAQSYSNLVYYSVLVQSKSWLAAHEHDDGFVYVGKFLDEYLPRVSNVLDSSKVNYDHNSQQYRSQVFIDLSDAADAEGLLSGHVCMRKSAASILAMVDLDWLLKQR